MKKKVFRIDMGGNVHYKIVNKAGNSLVYLQSQSVCILGSTCYWHKLNILNGVLIGVHAIEFVRGSRNKMWVVIPVNSGMSLIPFNTQPSPKPEAFTIVESIPA